MHFEDDTNCSRAEGQKEKSQMLMEGKSERDKLSQNLMFIIIVNFDATALGNLSFTLYRLTHQFRVHVMKGALLLNIILFLY